MTSKRNVLPKGPISMAAADVVRFRDSGPLRLHPSGDEIERRSVAKSLKYRSRRLCGGSKPVIERDRDESLARVPSSSSHAVCLQGRTQHSPTASSRACFSTSQL